MASEQHDRSQSSPLLTVSELSVVYHGDNDHAVAVDGLSFELHDAGETYGIVGESGSGKSMTALAILGLLPRSATVTGSIRFRGRELVGLSDGELRALRGNDIAMVFQDALAALNPALTVGEQIAEAVRVHSSESSRAGLRDRAVELLELVGIPASSERANQYPHEFSGGMRQRVAIAMGMANDPALLIADEPTTALDVTVQAQVLEVLRNIQERTGTTVMLITHDLGVVAGVADRVLVMYAGNRVEEGTVEQLFYTPRHPYTRALLNSLPRMDRRSRDQRLYQVAGQPPAPTALPTGCRFGPRCPNSLPDPCGVDNPAARSVDDHAVACHRSAELMEVPDE